jgi:putative FmdB family regulatory protein
MPVYTYRCENCGVQFDKTQKFTDNSLTRCPEFGKKSLRKVYQPVGIVFKGSGFYSTDNRSPSGSSRSNGSHAEDKDKQAETKSTDSKSSDSKPTDSKSVDTSKSTDTSKPTSTNEKAERKD